ncbi:MAG: SDR family NAD(P)-dependent oxidoreductase, partial [Planctomycetota bacterium]|nr:SDR family NAD(P)-dependent oxidoreductase [Planctomycetota bacterium]
MRLTRGRHGLELAAGAALGGLALLARRRPLDLRGKVVVITGGSRGLGLQMAHALGEAGARLMLSSRKADDLEQAVAELQAAGIDARWIAADCAREDDIQRLASETLQRMGDVDILVNNAGGGSGDRPGILFERTAEDAAAMIETNLTGMVHCCREFGRRMAEQGSGKIINIASMAGLMGRDRRMYARAGMKGQPVEYAAAKAGVIGLTQDLAGFLSPRGVYVNAISPGGFERGQPEQFIRDYSERTPLGRMGRDGVDLNGAI